MKTRSWLAVALGGAIAMAAMVQAGVAQEKKTPKPAAGSKTEQMMPGCSMHGAAAAEKAPTGKPGCAMMGGKGVGMGCCMGGGVGRQCCRMKGWGGGMGKAGCGMMGGGARAMGMRGCGMMGAGPGMGGSMQCGPTRSMGAGPCGPGMGLGCGPMMMRELDLSAEQQKKVADICERHQRLVISSQADIRVAELDLGGALREEHPDKLKINGLIDKVARMRGELAKATIGARLDVRAVLTPEQQKKWQAVPCGPMGMMDDEEFGTEN
jgi:Spy/CpxP family protein refolding chaperone